MKNISMILKSIIIFVFIIVSTYSVLYNARAFAPVSLEIVEECNFDA
mgnify:CR=1 FL=1